MKVVIPLSFNTQVPISSWQTTFLNVRLNKNSHHVKLLLAIYSYFAESEREFISVRTKQGLIAAKAQGKKLGRPKGSQNRKGRALDPFREQIMECQQLGLPVASIMKIVNNQLEEKLSYNSYKQFVKQKS